MTMTREQRALASSLDMLDLYPDQPIQLRFTNGEYREGTFRFVTFDQQLHPITMVVDDVANEGHSGTGLRMRLTWHSIRSYRCTPPTEGDTTP